MQKSIDNETKKDEINEYMKVAFACSKLQLLLQFGEKMTANKLKKPLKDKHNTDTRQDQEEFAEKSAVKCISKSCIRICAWILVIISIAIIVTTICLVIYQHIFNSVNKIEGLDFDDSHIFEEFNKTVRSIDDNDFAAMNLEEEGCHEKQCKIACVQATDLYESLYDIITNSSCNSTDVLLLQNQTFPSDDDENDWIHTNLNHPVKEVFIVSCSLTKIKNDAFNYPLFSETFLLSWYDLQLEKVESGALLGLYSLKYLTIDTKIAELGNAFFQPVQTTLTHLKLNAGLTFASEKSIFGVSFLQNLEYVDLSRNDFYGGISKVMFRSTPNLKYLVMSNSKIASIENDAFVNLVGKLNMLDLSKNLLTNISPEIIQPILMASNNSFINLNRNLWYCNCQIQELVGIYATHRSQFVNAIYCKAPHHLYGVHIDAVDYVQLGCNDIAATTMKDIAEQPPLTTSSIETKPQESKYFQMRCLSPEEEKIKAVEPAPRAVSLQHSDSSISTALVTSDPLDPLNALGASSGSNSDNYDSFHKEVASKDKLEYIRFEPPTHEFDLHLFANLSAQLVIDDFDPDSPINIIWFSDEMENFDLTHSGESIDYNCAGYAAPYMIIDGLVPNTTYTFCLIPHGEVSITPFSCLPLHVPFSRERNENIWISTDEKQFTVGILCLIFMLSLFTGAVIAYLGIKTYPDLLEGSKNVLVVKKPDQTCYVSTITEYEYLKNSSQRKGSMGVKAPLKQNSTDSVTSLQKDSLYNDRAPLKKNSLIPPLPQTPSLPPLHISAKNLEHLCSTTSASTGFEDCFVSSTPYLEDQYEMPKNYESKYSTEMRCVPNNYGMSPASPPPLPKRNSSLCADNLNLVSNRFSRSD